jgi:hypothetical protein
VRGLRVVLRGLSDTLENLLPFTLLSLTWWVAVFLVVPGPGATLTLFALTDPRLGSGLDRPGLREAVGITGRNLLRGWLLVFCTVPMVGVLVANLWFYGASDSRFALLVPLWFVLFVVALSVGLLAFSGAALLGLAPGTAMRRALGLTGRRLPQALVVVALLWLLLFVGTILVVPVFMFLPAVVAATANRFLLDGLGIPVVDPLTPTEERRVEEARGRASSRFGP